MNHATTAKATINEITNPITSKIHSCPLTDNGARFSSAPRCPCGATTLSRSYPVATTIVGIERKNENSNAAERDIPATWAAAMVDIDRDVPGNTADKI